MDIIMPDMEGIETIRELKQDFADIKIIAISGGGRIDSEDYLHLAKMFGAQRTYTKPFKRKEFLKGVKEILE
jgi:CheY-like chemotaxis protein